ncbi:hypothetical protein K438DRAFT_1961981 [Mycena galopus ATCC 62051]|nr:hypothetical protein K438DRAFT_1961981 [Mycena galopus ATCC 62051]
MHAKTQQAKARSAESSSIKPLNAIRNCIHAPPTARVPSAPAPTRVAHCSLPPTLVSVKAAASTPIPPASGSSTPTPPSATRGREREEPWRARLARVRQPAPVRLPLIRVPPASQASPAPRRAAATTAEADSDPAKRARMLLPALPPMNKSLLPESSRDGPHTPSARAGYPNPNEASPRRTVMRSSVLGERERECTPAGLAFSPLPSPPYPPRRYNSPLSLTPALTLLAGGTGALYGFGARGNRRTAVRRVPRTACAHFGSLVVRQSPAWSPAPLRISISVPGACTCGTVGGGA